jgi:hypothetical protein
MPVVCKWEGRLFHSVVRGMTGTLQRPGCYGSTELAERQSRAAPSPARLFVWPLIGPAPPLAAAATGRRLIWTCAAGCRGRLAPIEAALLPGARGKAAPDLMLLLLLLPLLVLSTTQ